MDSLITVNNISKIFKMYKEPGHRLKELFSLRRKKYHHPFQALKNISFEVKRNQTIGILGENGSGKSTLLQIIVGTLKPTSGNVNVKGRISSLLELGAGFNNELTGKENVFLHGAVMGLSQKEVLKIYNDIVNFADIGEFIEHPVKTYSSGMFVRLAFACAIHVDPDIMIIDEALSVGDLYFQQKSMRKIKELKESGKAILFVSHDIQAVMNLCDEVIWLEKGEIVNIGIPKDIAKAYQMRLHNHHNEDNNKLSIDSSSKVGLAKSIPNIDSRYGDGAAEIIGIDFMINSEPMQNVISGENITLRITVNSKRSLIMPIIGFTIRDRLSNIMFSTNTNQEDVFIDELKPNDIVSIDFDFKWPHLQPGNYSICPAIAEGTQDSHIMCDWIENAMMVKSSSDKQILGLLALEDCVINYNIVNLKE